MTPYVKNISLITLISLPLFALTACQANQADSNSHANSGQNTHIENAIIKKANIENTNAQTNSNDAMPKPTLTPIVTPVENKQVDLSKLERTRTLNHPPPTASTLPAVDSESLTIKTTQCFGTCPVYQLLIHADGKIEFDGIMHTSHEGKKSLTTDIATATDILTKAQAFRPPTGTETDNHRCHPRATDHPSYILTWKAYSHSNNDKKDLKTTSYHHYTGCFDEQSKAITQALKHMITQLDINDLIEPTKKTLQARPINN